MLRHATPRCCHYATPLRFTLPLLRAIIFFADVASAPLLMLLSRHGAARYVAFAASMPRRR